MFYPQLTLLGSLFPPSAPVTIGKYKDLELAQIQSRSPCTPSRLQYSVETFPQLSADKWNFIAISVKTQYVNAARTIPCPEISEGANSPHPFSTLTITNTRLSRDSTTACFPFCLFNESGPLFSALEVNQPMLMSPMILVPRYRPPKELQEGYLLNFDAMSLRRGVCIPRMSPLSLPPSLLLSLSRARSLSLSLSRVRACARHVCS